MGKILIATVSLLLGLNCAASKADAELTKLKVGYGFMSGTMAPVWVAKKNGIFTKHGLDVNLVFLQGRKMGLPTLLRGEISFLIFSFTGMFPVLPKGHRDAFSIAIAPNRQLLGGSKSKATFSSVFTGRR